ncbi:MAG TPA: hypothetical protein VK429_00610, partial [Patescibacteria group bacterium]|nr:hypothetical protein [Patescibacteria group bacterium]
MPGTLLFRKAPPGEQLAVVFLVGETPTQGVQREAMTSALNAIFKYPEKLLPCVQLDKSPDIRILGPYFSGSNDSLHHLLWAWNQAQEKENRKEIEIISGSATLDDNRKELTSDQENVSFHATVVPDGALTRTFYYKFLWGRLHASGRRDVALFVEGGTAYGSGYKERSKETSGPNRRSARWADPPGPSDTDVRLVVRFPLHVSQLRGAYEKENALQNPAPIGQTPRHALELALEAPEATYPDIVPAQDLRMTANIADLALTNGVETIRREGIRFVGIAASDPRDILFLARRIRESEANVTLFTFGSDILYTHPDYQRYLRGMLVVTPYPLFSPNQRWTGARATRISFPGSSEQGIYNAVLALLHDSKVHPGRLLEYRAPLTEGPPRLPIWVMAVGRHGFWPVWFTSTYQDEGYVYTPLEALPAALGPRPDRDHLPSGALLSFVLIETFFLLMMFLYTWTRVRWSNKNQRLSERMQRLAHLIRSANRRVEILFSMWSDRTARGIHKMYLFVLFLLFGLVQATLIVYVFAVRRFIVESAIALGFTITLLALLLLALLVAASREYIAYYRQGRRKYRCALVLVFSLTAALPLAIYLADVLRMPLEETLAFYGRSFDFASTLSPAIPFLFGLAVVCLWAGANIGRGFYIEVYGIFQPPGEWRLKSLEGLRPLRSSIRNLLDDP